MKKIDLLISLSFFVLWSYSAIGQQLVVNGYVEEIEATYQLSKGVAPDPGYIFFGDAMLISPHADSSGWTFEWFEVGESGKTSVGTTDSLVIPVNPTENISSLYQLIETNGSDSNAYRAWVFIPYGGEAAINFLKDEYDTLLVGINCDESKFKFTTNLNFSYYWIDTNKYDLNLSAVEVAVDSVGYLDMKMSNSGSVDYEFTLNLYEEAIILDRPIYEYTTFYVEYLRDSMNYTADTIHIIPRATKANLTPTVVNYDEEWDGFWYDTLGINTSIVYRDNYGWDYLDGSSVNLFSNLSGPAPLWVQFKVDESLNASKYIISFGNQEEFIDSTFNETDRIVYHAFTKPGEEYEIYLRTWNKYNQCENRSESTLIEVKKSNMTNESATEFDLMPNVFVSGIGENMNFAVRLQEVSVKYGEIKIYNRDGVKIHAYKGDIKEWPGWDGTLGSGGKMAPEGVYFYSVYLKDWAGKEIKGGDKGVPLTGFFHLYHN